MIWVLRQGKPAPVRIKVGLSDGTHVEVIEGELTDKDQVITAAISQGEGAATQASSKPQGNATARRGMGRGRLF